MNASEHSGTVLTRENTTVETSHTTSDRLHYLDNLRAIAMLLGVFLHAALAYCEPARAIWLATDAQGSVAIDSAIWFIHLFRMSLFFLLSGYFGKLLWTRRGTWAYLKSRLLRIALPFVLFYPFLWGAMMVVFIFALSYLKQPEGIMGLIAEGIKNGDDGGDQERFTAMHLWFLYYLMMFVLVSLLFVRLRLSWLNRALNEWYGIVGVCGVLIGAAWMADSPLPAPESFIPVLWPFLFYGTFYWLGWQLFGNEHRIAAIEKFAPLIFGICVLLYVPYYRFLPHLDIAMVLKRGLPLPVEQRSVLAVLTGILALGLTFSSLALGKRYLNGNRPTMRFLADASYWIYLVHLPLVIGLQTALIPLQISIYLKLTVVILVTLFFSMLSYVVLVRYTPIGWMLHGKRKFP
ncbi:MAG: acyltransferase family protein [Planctomycetaceae bacterium]|nr:acyltransferase family protein [Planctomycetaceae bacterium]